MDRRNFIGMAAAGSALAAMPAQAAKQGPLEKAVADYATAHDFSGTVLVEKGGAIRFHRGFGLADRASGIACTRDTRYPIASITKLFTAVLALRVISDSKIGLEAMIGDFLPNYRGEGVYKVGVRQLLNHTSGIDNFDKITSYRQAVEQGMPAYQLPHTSQALMDLYASGKLVREPGKGFEYNNADYVILGEIIAIVAGESWEAALRRDILDPLGLKATGLLRSQAILPGLATTYYRDGTAPLARDLPVFWENWYAAGGMVSTAADLLAFARALYGGKLLPEKLLAELLTPGLDDYGYGLWIASLKVGDKRHRFAQRPGSVMGANTTLLRFLDDDATVIILSNTNRTDIDAFGFHIGRALLA